MTRLFLALSASWNLQVTLCKRVFRCRTHLHTWRQGSSSNAGSVQMMNEASVPLLPKGSSPQLQVTLNKQTHTHTWRDTWLCRRTQSDCKDQTHQPDQTSSKEWSKSDVKGQTLQTGFRHLLLPSNANGRTPHATSWAGIALWLVAAQQSD